MPLLKELQDKVRATHLLVRPAEEWNKLSEKVQQAWASGDEQQLETARRFHLIAWASVARNILADPFEGVGITTTPASTDWGIATLTTSRRSCQPQLTRSDTADPSTGTQPRLRSFEEVMTDYDACLDYLAGIPSPPQG
ncbi:hypothetical protein [Arthrobacter sp. NicSoilB8]|uniref:hypothetical protein n=1 Tax=Arthrobacter sp. NicSoilB8 TaxID=2830998 RepID=UPI001CC4015C|nr:hypothetical protein [Arthrobacter sp. NicSoilB8]BCW73440.1 hypothetical protein NicSoilB8_44840 [Arthrobacter sp. NicSoilB8]